MSYILRHKPESAGINLDENGWAQIDEIIKNSDKSLMLSQDIIFEVVQRNDKKRFSISEDKLRIRANQGHSINVELDLLEKEPPEFLFHGTAKRFVKKIEREGLLAMSRQHVHLSSDEITAKQVGSRHGSPIVIKVMSKMMYEDGFKFYISENGVWLTAFVEPKYLNFEDERL